VEKNLHSKIFQMLLALHLLLILFGEQHLKMEHLLNRLTAVWMKSLLALLTSKELRVQICSDPIKFLYIIQKY
jgi:hypothetical protein